MNEKTRIWIVLIGVAGFAILSGVSLPTLLNEKELKPFHYISIIIAGIIFIILIITQIKKLNKVVLKPKQQEECTSCPFMSSWFTIILILLTLGYMVNTRFQFIDLHRHRDIIQISLISLLILRVGILFYTRNNKR